MLPKWLLPAEYMEAAFIAGGYAACPALASDIDVWVPGIRADKQEEKRADILRHLADCPFDYTTAEAANSGPGYEHTLTIRKVAVVLATPQPFHVMLVDGDVDAVLDGFDVSTHQLAITMRGIVKGRGWTSITVAPVALFENMHTPSRMEKIAARYLHRSEGA